MPATILPPHTRPHELIAPEQLGAMLAATRRCHDETAALRGEIAEIRTLIERGRGGATVLRWIGGSALALLLSASSWLLLGHLEHGDQITRAEVEHRAVVADVQRIDRQAATNRESVSGIQGDVREIRSTLGAVAHTVERIDEQIREGGGRRR